MLLAHADPISVSVILALLIALSYGYNRAYRALGFEPGMECVGIWIVSISALSAWTLVGVIVQFFL